MKPRAETNLLQKPLAQLMLEELSCCQMKREEKRNQIPLACVCQCLETKKKKFKKVSSSPLVSFCLGRGVLQLPFRQHWLQAFLVGFGLVETRILSFTCQVSPVADLQLSPTGAQGENGLAFLPRTL